MSNYLEKNKATWNAKTAYHLASDFYNMAGFLKGETSLNEVELQLLGDVRGKTILHLQCHFGQDSISLARMGAAVTGMDLSDKAIEKAKEIATQTNTDAHFICCDLYDLPNHLDQKFDIVFTSYGTVGWLPDMDKWAKVLTHFLKPGGRFVFVDFHPVVWMFDDEFKKIAYSYFNVEDIEETITGTYADKNAPITTETISWNHPLSEVLGSLLSNGMELLDFKEYDYSPYNCFKGLVEIGPKKFRLEELGEKIPMLYSMVAKKK